MSDDCILFTGGKTSKGYGACYVNGKQITAHRLAYIRAYGEIPKGMMVLHSCDVKACMNPSHLRLGTAKENMADALVRGQVKSGYTRPEVTGELHGNAVLTNQQVYEMRSRYEAGERISRLCVYFGVANSTAYKICKYQTYKGI